MRVLDTDEQTRAITCDEGMPTIGGVVPAADASPRMPIGTRVGRYVIEERIGIGGMGVVFRAHDPELDRVVALKCLRPEFVAQHGEARLVREARGMAQLSDPHVVAVYGVEYDPQGGVALAMEYVEGVTLRQWLRADRSPEEILDVMADAGRGLQAAHAAGLVHRDFKPSNVIAGTDGRVRVMDFGLVREERGHTSEPIELRSGPLSDDLREVVEASLSSADSSPSPLHGFGDEEPTQAGLLMGTVAYMAPELLDGDEADARGDQFAFCVSLWEALCGVRPYEGGIEASREAKLAGPPPWPSWVEVPPGVVALIRRGLAPDPEQRWPSMAALLEGLERARRRRGRVRSWWWAGGVALATAGMVTAVMANGGPGTPCSASEERLADVWGDAQQQAVQEALGASGSVHQQETWPRVQQRLETYAERWAVAHEQACRATHVDHEVGLGVLDQRMACLERARAEMHHAIELLTDADAERAAQAVKLVAGLPPPPRCLDAPSSHGRMPTPADPILARQVEALGAALVEVKARHLARKYDEGLAMAEELVARAQATGYAPIEGAAVFRRAILRYAKGEHEAARDDLLRAHAIGVEHGYARLAQQSASRLAYLVGYLLTQPEEGLRWAHVGVAEARRIDSGGALEADALERLAMVLHRQGRYDEAVQQQERALEILRRIHREESSAVDELEVALATDALGNMVAAQGRQHEAIELHRRALAIQERALGPNHLDVARSLNNLGSALIQQDARKGLPPLMRALAIREQVLGPEHPEVFSVVNNLGVAHQVLGQARDARIYLARALELGRSTLGPRHPSVGSVLINLGKVHEQLGDLTAARRYFRECLDVWEEGLGPEHPKLALALGNLGELSSAERDYDTAREYHERALALRRSALGDAHPLVADSYVELGTAMLGQGQPAPALSHGRAALAVIEGVPSVDPKLRERAHGLVGRALQALGREAEARPHLVQAQ